MSTYDQLVELYPLDLRTKDIMAFHPETPVYAHCPEAGTCRTAFFLSYTKTPYGVFIRVRLHDGTERFLRSDFVYPDVLRTA